MTAFPHPPAHGFHPIHFSVSAFQNLSFYHLSIPNGSREGNHSSLVKFTIFSQVSSPRFSASGRSALNLHSQCLLVGTGTPSTMLVSRAPFDLDELKKDAWMAFRKYNLTSKSRHKSLIEGESFRLADGEGFEIRVDGIE